MGTSSFFLPENLNATFSCLSLFIFAAPPNLKYYEKTMPLVAVSDCIPFAGV